MRFLVMHKSNEENEAGVPPSPELVEEMGKLMEESAREGVLLAAEGVHPSSKGARLSFSGGKRTVTDGPFAEAKELIAGFAVLQVESREEAIEWATRFADRDRRRRDRGPSGGRDLGLRPRERGSRRGRESRHVVLCGPAKATERS